MIEVKMPFYTAYVCQICGCRSLDKAEMLRHESKPITEEPDVKIGDEVEIYVQAWQQERFAGLSESPKKFSIANLYYASSKTGYIGGHRRTLARVHQLCVQLSQAKRVATGETRGLCEISQERCMNEGWMMSWEEMTWAEFCLWRKGDRAELESAGLVEPIAGEEASAGLRQRIRSVLGW